MYYTPDFVRRIEWFNIKGCYAQIFLLLLNVGYIGSVPIDNSVVGYPDVICGAYSIRVDIQTGKPFTGRIFVKGESEIPDCSTNPAGFDSGGEPVGNYGDGYPPEPFIATSINFELRLSRCNMRRQRTLYPRGLEYFFTLIVSFHPLFITKVDRAYRVRCFYMEAEKTVHQELEVSMLTTAGLEQQFPMPQCRYLLKRGSYDGPFVRYAKVGDRVFHVWECDQTDSAVVYGMLVKNCYVDDGKGRKFQLINQKGCAVDNHLIPEISYDTDYLTSFVETHVFKYADNPQLYFWCTIELCFKEDGGCDGVSPPECGYGGDLYDLGQYPPGSPPHISSPYDPGLFPYESSGPPPYGYSGEDSGPPLPLPIVDPYGGPVPIDDGDYIPDGSQYPEGPPPYKDDPPSEDPLKIGIHSDKAKSRKPVSKKQPNINSKNSSEAIDDDDGRSINSTPTEIRPNTTDKNLVRIEIRASTSTPPATAVKLKNLPKFESGISPKYVTKPSKISTATASTTVTKLSPASRDLHRAKTIRPLPSTPLNVTIKRAMVNHATTNSMASINATLKDSKEDGRSTPESFIRVRRLLYNNSPTVNSVAGDSKPNAAQTVLMAAIERKGKRLEADVVSPSVIVLPFDDEPDMTRETEEDRRLIQPHQTRANQHSVSGDDSSRGLFPFDRSATSYANRHDYDHPDYPNSYLRNHDGVCLSNSGFGILISLFIVVFLFSFALTLYVIRTYWRSSRHGNAAFYCQE